jgi:DNA mismatch endonuclease (patch repair protein)
MGQRSTNNYLGRNFKKEREPDKISVNRRSSLMSKIRSKGTKFERNFIAALKSKTKKRFKSNVKELKGKPDIVFEKYMICVFLDSDFWHGWQYPRWKHLLKNDFWRNKIEANRNRDKRNNACLKRKGWQVIRIWEHNINLNMAKEINKIVKALKNSR